MAQDLETNTVRRRWATRLLLGIVVLALGYVSVASSLAYSIRTVSPAYAYAMWPFDGRLAGALAGQISAADASPAQRRNADVIARRALASEPMETTAIDALGLNAQARADVATARRLFAYSEMVTRRDIQARVWAIEDAVAQNNIPGALHQYDIALRTSQAAPGLLFPVLEKALAEASVRQEMLHILSARPLWTDHFIGYISGNGDDPGISAQFFRELRTKGVNVPDWARAQVINRLIDTGRINDAWKFYASIVPGVDPRRSRDPRFMTQLQTPSIFDWQPATENGMTASIERDTRGGFFDFTVASGAGGTLLRQRQMLPAGSYVLEGRATGDALPEGQQPYWVLNCNDGREIGRVAMPPLIGKPARFSGKIVVPAECPSQMLSLIARSPDAIGGGRGQIDELRLQPL
jgi:hypothetical protein